MATESVAVGPWVDGAAQVVEAEGQLSRTAWKLANSAATTMQVMATLKADLVGKGFEILFECDTDRCGGFDFRYGIAVLPEPDMHVDLGDFRYLAARKGDQFVTALVSRSSRDGYVQITEIDPTPAPTPAVISSMTEDPPAEAAAAPAPSKTEPVADLGFAEAIELQGHVALDDLVFASGSAQLGDGDFPSLVAVADYLTQHPDRRITLVGHTDATGDLGANIALSRKRAQSVKDRLVSALGADAGRLDAEGAGYLAPRSTNLTEEGRQKNRRVEAMLASTR